MYKIVADVDIEDIHKAIRGVGRDPQDFEVTEAVTTPTVCEVTPETGAVTIRDKQSGVERFYPIGHSTIFPTDFIRDLLKGAFT